MNTAFENDGAVDDWRNTNISGMLQRMLRWKVVCSCVKEHVKKACVNVTFPSAAGVRAFTCTLLFPFGSRYAGIRAALSNRFNNSTHEHVKMCMLRLA